MDNYQRMEDRSVCGRKFRIWWRDWEVIVSSVEVLKFSQAHNIIRACPPTGDAGDHYFRDMYFIERNGNGGYTVKVTTERYFEVVEQTGYELKYPRERRYI